MLNELLINFEQSATFFYLTVTFVALAIGSFLNVVILRLPKILQQGWYHECRDFLADEIKHIPAKDQQIITLSTPSSTCPKCGHKIRFYENIPIISWLMLRGKCSQCQNNISCRYPVIEAVTAILSLVIASKFGVSAQTIWLMILTWGLVALTMIDLDHMLLPDQITLPLLWLGLLININGLIIPIEQAVIGAAAGYMSLYSVFWVFKLLTGKEGMGHGDFKLVAVFGAWMGWQLLPLLILMASAVGAIVGLSLIAFKGHSREQAIPFGPYLAVAGWITLLWGQGLWDWYLNLLA